MKKHFRNPKQLIALALTLVLLITAAPVAFAESFSAYVSVSSMAVYSNASLTGKLGSLNQYAVVTVLDYSGSVAKIKYSGKTGYARVSEMKRVEENSTEMTVIANTKVYNKASTSAASLSVKANTTVNVIAVKNGWALIEKDGVGAYIPVKYLSENWDGNGDGFTATATPAVTPTPTPDLSKAIPATVVVTKTGVYAGKTNQTAYLGSISKGTEVNVVEYGSTWAYIELDGRFGYCDITALVKTADLNKATPTPAVTPTPTADLSKAIPATVVAERTGVYSGKSNKTVYLGSVRKGTVVNVVDYGSTWAYIELGGNYGYCDITALVRNSALVTPTPTPDMSKAVPYTVIVDKVTVYADKTESARKLGTLKKGAQVNMVQYYDGTFWCMIELNGNYGYCEIFALKETAELEKVTPTPTPDMSKAVPGMAVASVKVYQSASTSSKVLGTLKQGKTVNVLDTNGSWAYIELGGNYGYCAVSALIPLLTIEESVKAVVGAASLDFYAAPSAAAKHLGRLSKGAEVNVLQVVDGWAYVEYKGNYGWCKSNGLVAVEKVTPTPTADPMDGYVVEEFTATVVTGSAKIYAGPGTGASQSVPMGANVSVKAYNNKTGWAAVVYGNLKGYIKISDLSRSEFASLSNGSSGTAVSTLEKALLSMGYFDDVPDSTYNSYTAESVKLFQATCGMPQSGNADAATQRVLYSGNAPVCSLLSGTYAKGSSGSNVTRIQRRLFALGYLSKTSSVDGDYGNNTYNAVGLFQQCNGLSANGTANSTTLKKLYSTGAAALPSGKRAADAANIVDPSTGDQKNNSTTISSTLKSTTSTYSSGMSAAEKIEYLIYVAQNQLGKPYVYGATGTSSFDCSGFTVYCFKQVGVSLPRTAQSQGYNSAYSRITSISSLKRGDLVYFNTVADNDACDHAGIYLGAGWFIHASSGQGKVVVSNLASNYYNSVFSWGHRPLAN